MVHYPSWRFHKDKDKEGNRKSTLVKNEEEDRALGPGWGKSPAGPFRANADPLNVSPSDEEADHAAEVESENADLKKQVKDRDDQIAALKKELAKKQGTPAAPPPQPGSAS